jgi:putative endonuclease
MTYFYVLENRQHELYYGSTRDLKKRLAEHRQGKSFSTRRSEWTLIYYEAYRDEADARLREQRIKQYGQARRQLLARIKTSRLHQS